MLFEIFREMRNERADAPAFYVSTGDRTLPISWKDFTDDIEIVSELIKTYCPGETVALLGENSYEWLTVHAAVIFSGAKVVPIDVNANADEIAEMTALVGAKVLVHSALYIDKADEVSKLRPDMVVRSFGSRFTDSFVDEARKRLKGGGNGLFSGPPPDAKAVSMLIFTSGTTSEPRAVQQTIEALETCCAVWAGRLDMKAGDHSLMVLPLHHVFGMCSAYLMLSQGVSVGICPDFRRLYDAVERFRADFLFLVPALAEILAGKIELRGNSADAALGAPVRWVLTGGAPMSMKTCNRLKALGIRPIYAYGLTETASLFSISPVDDEAHPCGAGLVADGYGVEIKTAADGELMIRGPNVFKGYFNEPERTAEALDADGWFHTGDIGEIDGDGFVTVKGRISRTIVLSSGKKIAPEELEGRILLLPGVLEVVVSGTGDSREIRAEVYASAADDKVREMVRRMNRQLPTYKRIREVSFRQRPFPRTASGKIRYPSAGRTRRKPAFRNRSVRMWRRRLPLVWSLSLCLAALTVSLMVMVPNIFCLGGVNIPPGLKNMFMAFDLLGEIMLAGLAVVFIFRLKRSSDR